MPDQTTVRITQELVKIFSALGIPRIVHSDQGQNFESTVLKQTLSAIGIHKSHTTSYHPLGDGIVKCFNRSLLQLLQSYVEHEADWECYLPLTVFAYKTATHTSTKASPFLLRFGRQPWLNKYRDTQAYDIPTYQQQLQAKLAESQGCVETNLVNQPIPKSPTMTPIPRSQGLQKGTSFGFLSLQQANSAHDGKEVGRLTKSNHQS